MTFDVSLLERRHTDGQQGRVVTKNAVLKSVDVDLDERLVKGIASTDGVDMDGDVVVQSGIDTKYFWSTDPEEGVRSVYWDHKYHEKPVGTCRNMKHTANGLYVSTYITKLPAGDEVLTLVREGIVRGLSIGFRTMEATEPSIDECKKYGMACNRVIRKSILLEYSLTAMPCNPEAMLSLKSLHDRSLVSKRTVEMFEAVGVTEEQPKVIISRKGLVLA